MHVRELPPLLEARKLTNDPINANEIKNWLEGLDSVSGVEIHLVPDPQDEDAMLIRLKVYAYSRGDRADFWVISGEYIVAPVEPRNSYQMPMVYDEKTLRERFVLNAPAICTIVNFAEHDLKPGDSALTNSEIYQNTRNLIEQASCMGVEVERISPSDSIPELLENINRLRRALKASAVQIEGRKSMFNSVSSEQLSKLAWEIRKDLKKVQSRLKEIQKGLDS